MKKTRKKSISFNLMSIMLTLPFFAYAEFSSNLIRNSDFEAADTSDITFPLHWEHGAWGDNTAVFTYPVPGVTGESDKGAKVELSDYANGDAKWFFEDIPVIPGEKYTFTDHYYSSVVTDIIARYTLDSGEYIYAYLGSPIISSDWTGYATLPFTIPNATVSMTIFHLIHEAGMLAIDNASLYREETPEVVPPHVTSVPSVPSGENNAAILIFSNTTHTVNAPPTDRSNINKQPLAVSTTISAIGDSSSRIATAKDHLNNEQSTVYTNNASEITDPLVSKKSDANLLQEENQLAAIGALFKNLSTRILALFLLAFVLIIIGATILFRYQKEKKT